MPAARTPAQALDRYRSFLQASLACVSGATWQIGSKKTSGTFVLLASEDPLRLKRLGSPLFLKATQTFQYARRVSDPKEWKVVTDAYAYTVSETRDLSREIWAWHWHPSLEHPNPHLHIGRGDPDLGMLAKLHVPTGRVSLEEVLLFLVEDCGIKPVAKKDWRATLEHNLAVFKEFRSWA